MLGGSIPVFPSLDITLMHNYGISFGWFADHGLANLGFLNIFSSVIILGLIIWFRAIVKTDRILWVASAAIIGGALGNLIDRIYLGYVVDFIAVYYHAWHFPVFNLADALISIGAFWVAIRTVYLKPADKHA